MNDWSLEYLQRDAEKLTKKIADHCVEAKQLLRPMGTFQPYTPYDFELQQRHETQPTSDARHAALQAIYLADLELCTANEATQAANGALLTTLISLIEATGARGAYDYYPRGPGGPRKTIKWETMLSACIPQPPMKNRSSLEWDWQQYLQRRQEATRAKERAEAQAAYYRTQQEKERLGLVTAVQMATQLGLDPTTVGLYSIATYLREHPEADQGHTERLREFIPDYVDRLDEDQ